ncbi:uncharacterized protein LOC110829767 [Zootermopsis nevadensis]|uniref:uncharacterized protein LOC110829767 n=1 Tax=Zootermopsis nevadensis TaxID=136037 RepID=UPI000B8E2375|nr:uncharacterized protein LOC110829767 [Zootermopsis nevadensis]
MVLRDGLLQLEIFLPQEVKSNKTGTVLPTDLTISSAGGEISLIPSVALHDGLTLADGAPQKWALELPDTSWSATSSGEYEREMTLRILVPKQKQTPTTSFPVNYRLYVCYEHSECKTYALLESLYMLKVRRPKLSTILLALSDRIKRNLQAIANHHNPCISFIFVTTKIVF